MLHNPKWEVRHKAKQVLSDAAQFLETHGWCQGALEHDGKYCMFGAIRAVHRCDHDTQYQCNLDWEIVERIRTVTQNGLFGAGSIAAWNDRPGRTKQEVIDALRAAAR